MHYHCGDMVISAFYTITMFLHLTGRARSPPPGIVLRADWISLAYPMKQATLMHAIKSASSGVLRHNEGTGSWVKWWWCSPGIVTWWFLCSCQACVEPSIPGVTEPQAVILAMPVEVAPDDMLNEIVEVFVHCQDAPGLTLLPLQNKPTRESISLLCTVIWHGNDWCQEGWAHHLLLGCPSWPSNHLTVLT